MAVLKSPRNSRNKGKWASAYALTSKNSNHQILHRKQIKISQKLHNFLQESAYWTSKPGNPSTPELSTPKSSTELLPRPNQFLVYGGKRFDSTLTSPLLFRKYLRHSTAKKRFFHLLNSYKD